VVWKRATRDDGLKAGYGVKFLAMSDRDQSLFEELLRSSSTTSFIPLGREGSAEMVRELASTSMSSV
jgi:hypothetical protein